jgi:hypothetical protein
MRLALVVAVLGHCCRGQLSSRSNKTGSAADPFGARFALPLQRIVDAGSVWNDTEDFGSWDVSSPTDWLRDATDTAAVKRSELTENGDVRNATQKVFDPFEEEEAGTQVGSRQLISNT